MAKKKDLVKKVGRYCRSTMKLGILLVGLLLFLMGILIGGLAVYKLFHIDWSNIPDLGLNIVNSISLLVIAIAIFDVAKYLLEQEVLIDELAGKSSLKEKLTRFMIVIFVALMLESLLIVFIASKKDIALLVYPSFLIIAVSFLFVAFGFLYKYIPKDIDE